MKRANASSPAGSPAPALRGADARRHAQRKFDSDPDFRSKRFERGKEAISALPFDPVWEAAGPALAGKMPVVFDADQAHEIRRVLAFAREFTFDAIVAGGVEADKVTEDLRAQKARVILGVNYPTRPTSLAPDADEPLSVLRRRASAPGVAAALEKAGVPFAFSSAGLKDMAAFVKNIGRAVKAGLAEEAAVRALTLGAATMAGAADRLGSIEKGRIANVIVTRVFLEYGTAMIRILSRVPTSDPSHAYSQRLLLASAGPSPDSTDVPISIPPAMQEPLSERELDVLRLLATPLSSAEIADRLFVATSTVRSHTKAIYGKLGVHTRLEAIEVAHDLRLI